MPNPSDYSKAGDKTLMFKWGQKFMDETKKAPESNDFIRFAPEEVKLAAIRFQMQRQFDTNGQIDHVVLDRVMIPKPSEAPARSYGSTQHRVGSVHGVGSLHGHRQLLNFESNRLGRNGAGSSSVTIQPNTSGTNDNSQEDKVEIEVGIKDLSKHSVFKIEGINHHLKKVYIQKTEDLPGALFEDSSTLGYVISIVKLQDSCRFFIGQVDVLYNQDILENNNIEMPDDQKSFIIASSMDNRRDVYKLYKTSLKDYHVIIDKNEEALKKMEKLRLEKYDRKIETKFFS